MSKDIAISLSIQREIKREKIYFESAIDSCMQKLGVRTLMNRSGIKKVKGFQPIQLLFTLIVLPVIKQSLAAVWSGSYFENLCRAQKDSYYRFLNHHRFNWRRFTMLLACRIIARTDRSPLTEKTIIADDTILPKTGENMELVSYHHDHKTNRKQLGYQMLQIGYHNGMRFYPIDFGYHTSKARPNSKIRDIDKRSNGWKRRQESFGKKTDLLVEMLRRCYQNGIDARFVLFDSWFAWDKVISQIVQIGYGVICRLKATNTRYTYKDRKCTLKQLWHDVARHNLQGIASWQVKGCVLNVYLPHTGWVRIAFIRWSKKKWHALLCTETDLEIEEILNYYSRRWVIECYFRDCKQLLELGRGQSENFDAQIAWASIVMIRYLLLVCILALRKQIQSIGTLLRELSIEHVQGGLIRFAWKKVRTIMLLSSQLFSSAKDLNAFFHVMDIIEATLLNFPSEGCAKL